MAAGAEAETPPALRHRLTRGPAAGTLGAGAAGTGRPGYPPAPCLPGTTPEPHRHGLASPGSGVREGSSAGQSQSDAGWSTRPPLCGEGMWLRAPPGSAATHADEQALTSRGRTSVATRSEFHT